MYINFLNNAKIKENYHLIRIKIYKYNSDLFEKVINETAYELLVLRGRLLIKSCTTFPSPNDNTRFFLRI